MTGETAAIMAILEITTRLGLDLYEAQVARRNGGLTPEQHEAAVAKLLDRSRSRVLAAHAAWDNPAPEKEA